LTAAPAPAANTSVAVVHTAVPNSRRWVQEDGVGVGLKGENEGRAYVAKGWTACVGWP